MVGSKPTPHSEGETVMAVSMEHLRVHVQDLRTVLAGLGYALGRQRTLDADQLRSDLMEICLPHKDNPDMVATELAILLGEAIARGKANSGD